MSIPAASPSSAAHSRVVALQERIQGMQATKLSTTALPTLPALADILPGGALREGAAYSIDGSTTLVMALLAGPSQSGAWCGVVGLPNFGAEAATRFGIDLERLVLVPAPGEQWLTVTAALVDVLTVVVTRPPRKASDADVARLGARLRQRGCALIVVGEWPQSEAQLRVTSSRWSGVGRGHGLLTGREVTVSSSGRTGFARANSTRLWLPDGEQQFRSAKPQLGAVPSGAVPSGAESRSAGLHAVAG
ncbi:hypothetical protein [Leifsonia kafniensis]|uniref:hypothetical protein n=1 Tax=Leifsonia kafniensis TaxID=475957 RepID=UPI0031EAD1E9